jgi:hypothetical protein
MAFSSMQRGLPIPYRFADYIYIIDTPSNLADKLKAKKESTHSFF